MAEKSVAETGVAAAERDEVPRTREQTRSLLPATDIYETPEALVVVADLPDVGKEDVSVRVEDDVLTIEGWTQHEAPRDAIYAEYAPGRFFRQFRLGEAVDQSKIDATLKNGVLTVTLPKTERGKPRQIDVNVS